MNSFCINTLYPFIISAHTFLYQTPLGIASNPALILRGETNKPPEEKGREQAIKKNKQKNPKNKSQNTTAITLFELSIRLFPHHFH